MNTRNFVLGAALAGASLLASTRSFAATIVVNVSSVPQLYQAFRDADARPSDWYEVRLAPGFYRLACPASNDPGDRLNRTVGSLKLSRGKVRLIGSVSGFSNDDYRIDGGFEGTSSRCSSLFNLMGSSSSRPQLELQGVRLQDAWSIYNNSPIQVNFGSLTLWRTTVLHTRATSTPGGALYAFQSTIRILDSFIQDATLPDATVNFCGGVFLSGGALYIANSSAEIDSSSIVSSGACRGGAIYFGSNSSSQSLTVRQSTLAQNFAINRGGGIFASGPGRVTLTFNTIALNTAALATSLPGESRYGGGIAFASFTGPLTMYGNVIAQNTTPRPALFGTSTIPDGKDCYVDGAFTSTRTLGSQLLGERGNCTFVSAGPLVGTSASPVDPQFTGLTSEANPFNGAVMDVLPLQPTSPAIGAFPGTWPLLCPGFDQLFTARVNPCDMGSIEMW